ncbi:MAG: methyltransferase domain-containing protein [Myxococcota bacterium]
MSEAPEVAFTGERLHAGSRLFGVDLARHRAAYAFAIARAEGARVLDLGCGSGYGAASLAEAAGLVVAIDRVRPDAASRRGRAAFVRADIAALPIAPASFDLIVSFQVIEHLEDPAPYLTAIARMLKPTGCVLVTTPNLLESDRVNPFHVREYASDELASLLAPHFRRVEMRGVGMTPRVRAYNDARLARIRRIMRLDVLGLHRRLPRPVIEFAFGQLAKVVRRGVQSEPSGPGPIPDVSEADFPVGPPRADDIDLLAVCGDPIA